MTTMRDSDPDIVILGGGPAGMSALIWCHSVGLRGLILERSAKLGGQLHLMYHRMTDYPGLLAGTGEDVAQKFEDHVKQLHLQYRLNQSIDEVDLKAMRVRVTGDWLTSRALIIATGARKRRLGIPGEDLFDGSGVSFTATRDHPLFAGRHVVVVGGGDSAFENALILARVCPSVTLIHRSEVFRAREQWIKEVLAHPHISIMTNLEVKAIEGGAAPTSVVVENRLTGERQSIPTQGVFVRLGMSPNTELFSSQLVLDEAGHIVVDRRQETSIESVYAAGDVCGPVLRSVATAVGQGALAVKAIADKWK